MPVYTISILQVHRVLLEKLYEMFIKQDTNQRKINLLLYINMIKSESTQ